MSKHCRPRRRGWTLPLGLEYTLNTSVELSVGGICERVTGLGAQETNGVDWSTIVLERSRVLYSVETLAMHRLLPLGVRGGAGETWNGVQGRVSEYTGQGIEYRGHGMESRGKGWSAGDGVCGAKDMVP